MRGLELSQKLRMGERVYGIALEGYGQPRWPRYFSDFGLDFVFIDSEHSPANRETIAWAVQTYAAYGIAPLLRIPSISAAQAAMGIDAGAHGIIVPYVETVEQVKSMVGAVKYRPLKGKALQRAVETGEFANVATEEYLAAFNSDAVLVIMIESPTGVENLPDLLAVSGVDCVFIGPHDLSISLGIPEQYDHPQFIATVERVIAICKAHQVGVGMHTITGSWDEALVWARRGFNFISHRGDTLFIARGIQGEMQRLRATLENIHTNEEDAEMTSSTTDVIGASGHGI